MDEQLADLLLAPETVSASVREHVEGCAACSREFGELRAAMGLLDQWQAPEPSPYFLTRVEARLREARQEAPQGWMARLRDRFFFAPQAHTRPIAAMALTVMLLVGGGAYLGVTNWVQPKAQPDQTATVVHDLQNMDSNAQLLDQLEQLGSNDNSSDSSQQ
jgi:hypothetical protein